MNKYILCLVLFATTAFAEKPVSVATFDDLQSLYQKVLTEGHHEDNGVEELVSLEYQTGGLHRYVTIAFGMNFGGSPSILSMNFIQEQWRKDARGWDIIDQWIVVINSDGSVRNASHVLLVEDDGRGVSETRFSVKEKETIGVTAEIVNWFLGRLKLA